jgi:hypothetical protein
VGFFGINLFPTYQKKTASLYVISTLHNNNAVPGNEIKALFFFPEFALILLRRDFPETSLE